MPTHTEEKETIQPRCRIPTHKASPHQESTSFDFVLCNTQVSFLPGGLEEGFSSEVVVFGAQQFEGGVWPPPSLGREWSGLIQILP